MDKNTIYGLLLMAAIFFGFMWLQPKNENPDAQKNATDDAPAAQSASSGADSLSASEREWLVSNIAENGTVKVLADSSRVTTIDENGLHLTLRGDSISGTVEVGGRQLQYADIVNRNLGKISIAEQRNGIEILRARSASMGRFGKFARFLSGRDTVVKVENDALALQISAKSGSITRAELKKYDTEYSSVETEKRKEKVVIFQDSTNSMAFGLPLPQDISTRDLYFTPRVLNDSTVLMALEMTPDAYWGIEYTLPKGENYLVRMRIVQKGMAPIVQSNNRNLRVDWKQDIKRQEKGRMFEERNSGLYYKFAGGSVENLSEAKNDSEERQAKIKWIAFKNQFFSSVLISKRPFNTADFDSKVLKGSDYLKSLETTAVVRSEEHTSELQSPY